MCSTEYEVGKQARRKVVISKASCCYQFLLHQKKKKKKKKKNKKKTIIKGALRVQNTTKVEYNSTEHDNAIYDAT
jgi:hypothetical protein